MEILKELKVPARPIQCCHYADGEWFEGNGQEVKIESPYFGKVIGQFNSASKEDVDHAVKQCHKASEQWRLTPMKERTQVMFRFREIILARKDEIAHWVSLENGKTLAESMAGIMKGVEVLEYALSLQNLDRGAKMEVSRQVFCEYRREPLGVVASITPFNFPFMVPMWSIPIALTLGNGYVWKPSDKTPLTSLIVAECLEQAGLPKGVLSILQGQRETVEHIIDHELVKAVAFVGSSVVAKSIFERASSLGKRSLALGGAKNHIILLPDADSALCGRGISDSFTGCAGQRCMAASVLLAVGDVEKQIQQIVERARSQILGVDMGALISKEQVEFLKKAIESAEKDGAKILLDGRNVKAPGNFAGGNWLGPTIIDHAKAGSEAATKELFGPILTIIRCETLSQALEIENAIDYGNACSVFTSNGGLAEIVASKARAGMVGINVGVPVPREPFSFGGINYSKFGYGDITGDNSLNFWTDVKKITTKWEMQSDHNWMS